jgi:acetyl esterase/lipase
MKSQIFVKGLLVLLFLFGIALFYATIWSLIELYGDRLDWWGGNAEIQSTPYTIFGAPLGTFLMVTIIYKSTKSIPKVKLKFRNGLVGLLLICGIVLPILCLPYFTIPQQVGDELPQEFADAWGTDWESKIKPLPNGPWLEDPYSVFLHYGELPYDASNIKTTLDIEFLSIGNDSFKCDIYQPAGKGPFPVIINIHGGGWIGGDKDFMIEYQRDYLVSAGYVIISVQYGAVAEQGISRQYSLQEIMDNLAHFSDWLAQPAVHSLYDADISRSFVIGLSAGGHLSALLSVARFNMSNWNPAIQLRGGIDFYGITDIQRWFQISTNWLSSSGLFNSSVIGNPSIVDPYSPLIYVNFSTYDTSSVVPMLILHGDVDVVVDVEQSRWFDDACDTQGLKCVYVEIPKGCHVFETEATSGASQICLWSIERFLQLCLSEVA